MTLSATSLKLPRDLKNRIEKLARLSGESPHAVMVRALADHVDAAERRQAFLEDAVRADEAMIKAGTGFPMDEAHAYLSAKVRGQPAKRPRAVRWRK